MKLHYWTPKKQVVKFIPLYLTLNWVSNLIYLFGLAEFINSYLSSKIPRVFRSNLAQEHGLSVLSIIIQVKTLQSYYNIFVFVVAKATIISHTSMYKLLFCAHLSRVRMNFKSSYLQIVFLQNNTIFYIEVAGNIIEHSYQTECLYLCMRFSIVVLFF